MKKYRTSFAAVIAVCILAAIACRDSVSNPKWDTSDLSLKKWESTYFNFDGPENIFHVYTDPPWACWALYSLPNMMGVMVAQSCQERWYYEDPVVAQSSIIWGNNDPWSTAFIYWEWYE